MTEAPETRTVERPKCGTRPCNERATQRVYWPAQTIDLCDDCTRRARRVAEHLGFEVRAELLP